MYVDVPLTARTCEDKANVAPLHGPHRLSQNLSALVSLALYAYLAWLAPSP